MSCPACGGVTAEGDVFCGGCGVNLAEARATCRNCGAVNRSDARFCTSCGSGVGPDAPAPAEPAPSEAEQPATPAAAPVATAVMPPPAPATAQPTGSTPAPAAPAAAGGGVGFRVVRPVSLVGAGLAVVGTFLAWFDIFGGTVNAFDVPIQFLFDYQTTAGNNPSLGILVLALAAVAAAGAVFPSFGDKFEVVRLMGLGLLAVAVAFNIQLALAAGDIGVSYGDIYGFGSLVSGVGGVLVLVGK